MTALKIRPGARRPRPTCWTQAAPGLPGLRAKRVDAARAQESLANVRAARDLRAVAREVRALGLSLGRNGLCDISERLELEAALLLPPDERGAA